eukprot:scaffold139958_cov84-Phaeocystis_antarctica.AAC.1
MQPFLSKAGAATTGCRPAAPAPPAASPCRTSTSWVAGLKVRPRTGACRTGCTRCSGGTPSL